MLTQTSIKKKLKLKLDFFCEEEKLADASA